VVWYTGHFYALFFLTETLKVNATDANMLVATALLLGAPFFVLFGHLSDRIGRKPVMLTGCLLAVLTYFPAFNGLTQAANPALHEAHKNNRVTLLGWPLSFSVIVMGSVTIVYTVVGGLRSVVWNDCIQFVIYILGGLAAVFVLADRIPGHWNEVFTYAMASGKLQPFNFQFQLSDPFNFWAGLIGGAVLTIGTHGTDHMMVQRYLSARSLRDAGKSILASGVVVFLQFVLFLFIGIQLACFFSQQGQQAPAESDQIFVHFIVGYFPRNTGLIGLMLAAVLSAAMSTLSSSLNASASAVLNDFWIPLSRSALSSARQVWLSRVLTVGFGILQMVIGIQAAHLETSVVQNALTIAGFSAGILLGTFSLGIFSHRAGQAAAITGACAGLLVLLFVQLVLPRGSDYASWLPTQKVAWPWLALIGSVTTYVVGELAACLLPLQRREGTAGDVGDQNRP